MTASHADFTQTVLSAIDEDLAARGFERLASGIYARHLADDCRGWVGVGVAAAKRGGAVDANPMVGVRHEAVEALLDEENTSATVFRPLYELFEPANYRTWTFERDGVVAEARTLGDALEEIAVPFMQSLAPLEAIERALSEWAFADIRRRRLPAVALIRHGEATARAVAERELDLLDDEAERAEYKAFAARLLDAPR